MLKKYFRFAFRSILKEKFHSLLNILGLSVGIASVIIIMLYLEREMGFDNHHEKGDRIYRLSNQFVTSGKPVKFAFASPSLGPKLIAEYPEIENYVRIFNLDRPFIINKDEIEFIEEKIVFADSSFFDVFDYKLLQGNKKTCLTKPESIVLTKKLANKIFGKDDPVGKTIATASGLKVTVTGVMEDLPENVHMPINAIISYTSIDTDPDFTSLDWSLFEIQDYTYILVNKGFTLESFNKKWPAFYEKYCKEDGERYGQVFELIFRNIKDVHYNKDNLRFDFPVGNKSYIYAFISIGIFILILACINYINLATSVATKRSKEIGVKKVLGSGKRQLIFQFMGESILSSFIATLIAVGLTEALFAFTPFNQLINIELKLDILHNIRILLKLTGLFLLIGLFSGLYPAFFLSSFRPSQILSGVIQTKKHKLFMRKFLVTFQFIISISVIIITLFMSKQINYVQNFDLGFKKDNILSMQIQNDSLIKSKVPALTDELLSNTSIKKVTKGRSLPGKTGTGLYRFEGDEGMEEHNYYVLNINHDYLETLQIPIIKGRDFSEDFSTDNEKSVIVNEALVNAMGWDNPIGKKVTGGRSFDAVVIGVVKDFHYFSLHNQIEPLLIRLQTSYERGGFTMIIEIDNKNISNTLELIEQKWQTFYPDTPFQYSFLDDDFNAQYLADINQNKLVKIFAMICIIISCLGLFGLSSYTSQKKTKEIGIRKAHGASIGRIIFIILKEYIFLILIAFVIALPISILYINNWLDNYAIQSPLGINLFIFSFIGTVLITILTSCYHSIKVALTNPVEALRYE